MEIIVSVFAASVAMSCLVAVVISDIKDKKSAVPQEAETTE